MKKALILILQLIYFQTLPQATFAESIKELGYARTYTTIFGSNSCNMALARFESQPLTSRVLVLSAGHCLGTRSDLLIYNEESEDIFNPSHMLVSIPREYCPIDTNPSDCVGNQLELDNPNETLSISYIIDYANNHYEHDILIGHLEINYIELIEKYGLSVPIIDEAYNYLDDSFYFFGTDWSRKAGKVRYCNYDSEGEYTLPVPYENPHYTMDIVNALILKDCTGEVGESGSPVYNLSHHRIVGIASTIDREQGLIRIQKLEPLRSCFDDEFKFTPSLPDCSIPIERKKN